MNSTIDETTVRDEIGYFENQAARARSQGRADVGDIYLGFLDRRRQLLAAIRAGRPWAWREYDPSGSARPPE